MWNLIIEFFLNIFRRDKVRDTLREDFAEIANHWEKFTVIIEKRCENLETKLEETRKQLIKCETDRIKIEATIQQHENTIMELKNRVSELE